jgi:hypothetical protein
VANLFHSQQCGGLTCSNLPYALPPGTQCTDAPYTGVACTKGFKCTRANAHWWDCQPLPPINTVAR